MIIGVLNGKGGVGRTTVATHAAAWLEAQGLRVAFVDADHQAGATRWLSGARPRMIVRNYHAAADILDRVPPLATMFDAVVIDAAASISAESAAIAAVADTLLIPMSPSMMDINASYETARQIHLARRARPRPNQRIFVVLNRVLPRSRVAHIAAAAIFKFGFAVARTALWQRVAYAEAAAKRRLVWALGDSGRPAAREMEDLFRGTIGADFRKAGSVGAPLPGMAPIATDPHPARGVGLPYTVIGT